MIKRTLLIVQVLLIGFDANAQISDTITLNYKIEKFETLLKYNNSKAVTKFDDGICNFEISFNKKGNEIVLTNEEGAVVSFYKIMEVETKKYSPTKISTTYQCIGMDSKLVIIILSKNPASKTKDAEVYISISTLLHSIIYHFNLKYIKS